MSWSRSVSIVSAYRLDDQATSISPPAGAKDFSCRLCVQTSSEARPASCPMCTVGPFLSVKCGQGEMPTTHPPLALRSKRSMRYTSLPLVICMKVVGQFLLLPCRWNRKSQSNLGDQTLLQTLSYEMTADEFILQKKKAMQQH
jgi:hypothetical protein